MLAGCSHVHKMETVCVCQIWFYYVLLYSIRTSIYTDAYLMLSQTEIRYVTVTVYNILVRMLHDGPLASGMHRLQWDGETHDHFAASSGVYFFIVSTGNYHAVRRALLLH